MSRMDLVTIYPFKRKSVGKVSQWVLVQLGPKVHLKLLRGLSATISSESINLDRILKQWTHETGRFSNTRQCRRRLSKNRVLNMGTWTQRLHKHHPAPLPPLHSSCSSKTQMPAWLRRQKHYCQSVTDYLITYTFAVKMRRRRTRL